MAETFDNAPAALPKNSEAMREAMFALIQSLDEGKLDPSGQKVAALLLGEYLRIQENMRRYWEARTSGATSGATSGVTSGVTSGD